MKIINDTSSMNPSGSLASNPNSNLNFTRRALLKAIPAVAFAPGLFAQSAAMPIAVQKLHSFDLRVSDVARSLQFYQDLFGAPVQARQGETVCLRIGPGPRYFSLSPVQAGRLR